MKNTPYNNLPIVIDKVGLYKTRGGLYVEIDRIEDHSDNYSVTRFNCKGAILHKSVTGMIKREYNIWHESGMFSGVAYADFTGGLLDIVAAK